MAVLDAAKLTRTLLLRLENQMALSTQYSLLDSEFNEFLHALVGEEKNGTQLTVLSALTRLGLDPWGEAARLSQLPKDAASRALAATIALLPEGDWRASDSRAIATRLVARLPRRDTAIRGNGSSGRRTRPAFAGWVVVTVLATIVVFAVWRVHVERVSMPAPSDVSSRQR